MDWADVYSENVLEQVDAVLWVVTDVKGVLFRWVLNHAPSRTCVRGRRHHFSTSVLLMHYIYCIKELT